jgi:hypothetical protein
MAESNTIPVTRSGKTIQTFIKGLVDQANRTRYLAMAAASINCGSTPVGMERENCVAYLLDTIAYLGELASAEGEEFEDLDEIMKAGQP